MWCSLLGVAAAMLAVASPVAGHAVHEEAAIISVNGTFNTHFSAHVKDLNAGECVIFEAQAQAPQPDGELCLSGAGVKMTGVTQSGGHPLDAGRLLPKGCKSKGLRIAEVVTDDATSCYMRAAQSLDNPAKVFEECDESSPFAYQFIDPTRHDPPYMQSKGPDPIAHLCSLLLEAIPQVGSRISDNTHAILTRHNHPEFHGKCLKSVTYVVANPCDDPIRAMLFEGDSDHCMRDQRVKDSPFKTCSKGLGGHAPQGALAKLLSGIVVLALIAGAATAAAVVFLRKRRQEQQRRSEFSESTELTAGKLPSERDPDDVEAPAEK